MAFSQTCPDCGKQHNRNVDQCYDCDGAAAHKAQRSFRAFNFTKFFQIKRTLGTRAAAGYARNRGVSFEDCYWTLFGCMPHQRREFLQQQQGR